MKAEKRSSRVTEAHKPLQPKQKPAPRTANKPIRHKQANLPILVGSIIAVAVLAITVTIILSLSASGPKNSNPGSFKFSPKAKDFTLADTEGRTHTLSNFVGMPVILDFSASWCGPCRAQAPAIKKLYNEFKDKVQFLTVDNIGGNETEEKAKEFKEEEGMDWPMLLDMTGQVHQDYSVSGIPTILLLDQNGVPYYTQTSNKGEMFYTIFKQELEKLFAGER